MELPRVYIHGTHPGRYLAFEEGKVREKKKFVKKNQGTDLAVKRNSFNKKKKINLR